MYGRPDKSIGLKGIEEEDEGNIVEQFSGSGKEF